MKYRVILLLLCLFSLKTYAESSPKIYLTTIGPGDELFLRWGHFAIIVDYENRRDLLFDYGNFSFQNEDFVPEFISGIMTYLKLKKSATREIEQYKLANRTITLQELNLTESEVELYIDKLYNDIRPENRFYQYDHYYNNCVSQMIEYLDTVTSGSFFEGTNKFSGRSFRDYSRDYVSSNYFNNLLIMFVLGSKVDDVVTEKEAMFLPDYAMFRAAEVMIPDGNGGEKPLIRETKVLYSSVGRDPVITNAKPKYLINLLIGVFVAIVVWILRRFTLLHIVMNLISGLLLGITGSLLFFMSFFTGHYYIHSNWNLILINPLTLILFISGIFKISRKSRSLGERIENLYIDTTLLFTIAMTVLKSIGLIQQQNGEIILLILPILIIQSSLRLLISYSGRGVKLSSNPGSDS